MKLSPAFRHAFLAGLAAPAGLYAAPAKYLSYIPSYSVAACFGAAGCLLTHAAAEGMRVGQAEQICFDFG